MPPALPAMHIRGEEDGAVPTEMAIGMFKGLWPNGSVTRLPGVGHFLQEDAPEAVTALISQFIQMTRTVRSITKDHWLPPHGSSILRPLH